MLHLLLGRSLDSLELSATSLSKKQWADSNLGMFLLQVTFFKSSLNKKYASIWHERIWVSPGIRSLHHSASRDLLRGNFLLRPQTVIMWLPQTPLPLQIQGQWERASLFPKSCSLDQLRSGTHHFLCAGQRVTPSTSLSPSSFMHIITTGCHVDLFLLNVCLSHSIISSLRTGTLSTIPSI